MMFTENKERVRAIPATKYKKICGGKIYSRTRTFGAKVHKWNIRVKRWQNKYEIINQIERQLLFELFAYQVQYNRTALQTYKAL